MGGSITRDCELRRATAAEGLSCDSIPDAVNLVLDFAGDHGVRTFRWLSTVGYEIGDSNRESQVISADWLCHFNNQANGGVTPRCLIRCGLPLEPPHAIASVFRLLVSEGLPTHH